VLRVENHIIFNNHSELLIKSFVLSPRRFLCHHTVHYFNELDLKTFTISDKGELCWKSKLFCIQPFL